MCSSVHPATRSTKSTIARPRGNAGTTDWSLCRRDRRGGVGAGVRRVARSRPIPTATTARRPMVFVCRTTGTVSRRCLVRTPEEIAHLVNVELDLFGHGGVRLTRGDARCIAFGHVMLTAV